MDVVGLFNLVGNVFLVAIILIVLLAGIGYALIRYWKKYRWAANYYSTLLVVLPSRTTLYINRSWAWLCLREYEHALADCEQAIKLNDQIAMAYNNRAAAYLGLNRYQDAIRDAQHAIQLDDKLWLAYCNRGCALSRLKANEQAVKDFDLCIEQQPNVPNQYFGRADCYLRLQQYELAIQDYTRGIELNARAWNAYHNRAYAYMAIDDVERGYADICKSCELHPSELIHRLSKAWFEFCIDPRLTPVRVEEFAALSTLEPQKASLRHSYQGMLYWLRGEYEQALTQFELGIESEPYHNEDNYFWSGMALAALGRYDEAARAIDYSLKQGQLRFFLKTLALLKDEHAEFVAQYPSI
ncbi:tetratricopeptide repeat protein [Dictyobacter formicarum]|uniref:Tetratricopeptide repeat protein n=1 Tax=Dictyobacter formicarum TaxID=2778368 RepID=A0ABQ3VSN1_9CHLR|nr:tetratricopeptide repeat protein [Dictyobacter formicarum]GHO88644.1 hypothetical protein KSZ_66500 [Dictyobacter formicarum]